MEVISHFLAVQTLPYGEESTFIDHFLEMVSQKIPVEVNA